MKTLSLGFDDVAAHDERVESTDELNWLGDLEPGLNAKKSARFITQTVVGIAIVLAILLFI